MAALVGETQVDVLRNSSIIISVYDHLDAGLHVSLCTFNIIHASRNSMRDPYTARSRTWARSRLNHRRVRMQRKERRWRRRGRRIGGMRSDQRHFTIPVWEPDHTQIGVRHIHITARRNGDVRILSDRGRMRNTHNRVLDLPLPPHLPAFWRRVSV